jgi:hypothetical protein
MRNTVKKITAAVAASASCLAFAQSCQNDMFNAPTRNGDVTLYTIDASGRAGLTGLQGQVGGGRVTLDATDVAKGATTCQTVNAPKHDGKLNIYSTGSATAGSIRVDEGAKTGSITNVPTRQGNATLIAVGVAGDAGILSRGGQTTASATIDSVHVCAGATTGRIQNSGQTKGNLTAMGNNILVNSIRAGC